MALSISIFRLPHLPPTTTHLPHPSLPSSSLKPLTLTSSRRKPIPHLILTHCQPPAAELQTPDQTEVTEQAEPELTTPNNTRILVQNVPWTCTADDIRPLLAQYGTVLEIDLAMYSKSRNRGLAFVTMSNHEEACSVIENLQSVEFQGRSLNVNWATKPKPVKHNVFVSNLAFQARAKDLKEFFNSVSAEVIFDANKRATGYGFVSFSTKAEAEAAIEAFQGKEFMERPIRVAASKRLMWKEKKEEAVESQPEVETAIVT